MNEQYQIFLEEIRLFLLSFENELQTKILNLIMSGEMADWDSEAEIGDEIELNNDFYDAIEDENVKNLSKNGERSKNNHY